MSLSTKQEKGISFLDSFASLILHPFQNLFTQSIKSVSDGVNHYLDLVNISKENDRLKSEVERLINEKNELIERISGQKRIAALMVYQKDRIKNQLAVVTKLGVIGQIIHSGFTTSKVLLTIDSRSAIDAVFQKSRVSGVVVGTGDQQCQVKFVPNTAKVQVGDRVLSSGLGGVFPKGLVIGTVSQVVRKKQGLFQEITLTPSSDFSNLEEVLVFLS